MHPAVVAEIKRKWYGAHFDRTDWKRWKALFMFCCLFDLVLFPILFVGFSLMTRKNRGKTSRVWKLKVNSLLISVAWGTLECKLYAINALNIQNGDQRYA